MRRPAPLYDDEFTPVILAATTVAVAILTAVMMLLVYLGG